MHISMYSVDEVDVNTWFCALISPRHLSQFSMMYSTSAPCQARPPRLLVSCSENSMVISETMVEFGNSAGKYGNSTMPISAMPSRTPGDISEKLKRDCAKTFMSMSPPEYSLAFSAYTSAALAPVEFGAKPVAYRSSTA